MVKNKGGRPTKMTQGDEFKTKTKLEHDGNVSVSPHNPFEALTVEELRALIAEDEG